MHLPPWTEHVTVGAGDGPCAVLMVGTRSGDEKLLYPAAEVAQRHGAAAKEETPNPREAYADYERAEAGAARRLGHASLGRRVGAVHAFDVEEVRRRLEAGNGGYEVVHESSALEVGVYVLVAPEPDRQQPHDHDELYVVLDGTGELEVEGERVPVGPGKAVFVEAGADHRFSGYEGLAVLVLFDKAGTAAR